MTHPENTQVILLGTGTPNAEPDRSGPSVVVIVGGRPYLVDCGPGVVRRVSAAHLQGHQALAFENLETLFLTHLHSDHTAGLPDLLLTPWVLGRSQPLQIYGPRGTKSMCEHIRAAYEMDIHERLTGLEPANDSGFQAQCQEVEGGLVHDEEGLTVEAFPANHGSWVSFSYRFTTPEGTIVISGDTAPHDSMQEIYAGCHILIHEVYSSSAFQGIPEAWKKYHTHVHTSSKELAEIAAQTQPGLVVLYHQLYWGQSDEGLVREIASLYDGKVVSGKDLSVFTVGDAS